MRVCGLLLMMGFLVGAVFGREGESEAVYRDRISKALGGKVEVKVENGKVDVLTATHAIEVEFPVTWKHAVGQALWYGKQTGKRAGVVLVLEDEGDEAMVERLRGLVRSEGLKMDVWVWPRDFVERSELAKVDDLRYRIRLKRAQIDKGMAVLKRGRALLDRMEAMEHPPRASIEKLRGIQKRTLAKVKLRREELGELIEEAEGVVGE